MKQLKQYINKIEHYLKQNLFLSLFIGIVALTLLVALIKIVGGKDEFIYAKVKVSQGLWWANTNRPNVWLSDAIKVGDIEKSLTGKPIVEVLSVRKYPFWISDQFDVYLTLKLKISKSDNTGKITFKRSSIGVGAPIDLEFPDTQFSATIIAISDQPFKDSYVEKQVTLTKNIAYSWEYDAITIGDSYSDGEQVVFEILDKSEQDAKFLSFDSYGQIPGLDEMRSVITIKAKMKLVEKAGNYVFGEEQLIKPGKEFGFSTNNLGIAKYIVIKIEDMDAEK